MLSEDKFFSEYDIEKTDLSIYLLETVLGTFTLSVTPGPMDSLVYQYTVRDKVGPQALDRLDALLEFLIQYKNVFADQVYAIFGKLHYCTFTLKVE